MDVRFGLIASVLANIYRDSKKKAEPYSPADFFPGLKEKEEEGAELAFKRMFGYPK